LALEWAGKARGFTLIELITCIVILGILAAVIGPRFLDNSAFAARGYSDEIAATLRQSRAIAVGSGCDVSVVLNAATYQALQRAAAGNHCVAAPGAWTTPVLRIDGSPLSGNAPANVTLAPATQIVFDGNGRIVSGPPPLLTIGAFTLRIDPGSGLVEVQ
jgi:MSHA pilin protein MshC